jgi:hypothetical protein
MKRNKDLHLFDFGIPDRIIATDPFYDNFINDEHRRDNMVNELKLEVRHKKFTYKDIIPIQYDINSRGFRSIEFVKYPDVITSGCSQSFGIGMPYKYIWPNLLDESNSLKVVNISYPGTSTQTIVEDIFRYINEYGNPKYIRILVPDFIRFQFLKALNSNYYIEFAQGQFGDFLNTATHMDHFLNKYEKLPISIEKIMPYSVPFRASLMNIKILESYCEAAKIDFKWATWDSKLKYHFSKHDYGFKNYVSNSDLVDYSSCHFELKEEFEKLFYLAADKDQHMGTHAHAHYAKILSL